jgi:hypothetical protein
MKCMFYILFIGVMVCLLRLDLPKAVLFVTTGSKIFMGFAVRSIPGLAAFGLKLKLVN